ncbi:hypothetical protein Scep_014587 [Stephania cephalantha]|uniref:Uncharacterized protein n=1 Tax=Stephania cephalantha TaxID=152367 RepID=A0AAP0P364_9MAGN
MVDPLARASPNIFYTSLIVFTCSSDVSTNSNISSAKKRCDMSGPFLPRRIPHHLPSSTAF